jgi:hypothetical protein
MIELILRHEYWIAAALLVLAAACTAHYKLHLGALNTADSAAYDTLLIAEAAIDQARAENQTRPFSAEAKDSLNRLVQTYNIARETWLTYRGAVAANLSSDQYFQQLNSNLSDLAKALEALNNKDAQRNSAQPKGEEVQR